MKMEAHSKKTVMVIFDTDSLYHTKPQYSTALNDIETNDIMVTLTNYNVDLSCQPPITYCGD